MSDEIDAENFFFVKRAPAANNQAPLSADSAAPAEQPHHGSTSLLLDADAAGTTAANDDESGGGGGGDDGHSLPAVDEVTALASQLLDFAANVSRAIAALAVVTRRPETSTTTASASAAQKQLGTSTALSPSLLPQMSAIELRRQQQTVREWDVTLARPMQRAILRWQDEVHANIERIRAKLAPSAATTTTRPVPEAERRPREQRLQDLDAAFQQGSAAVNAICSKRQDQALLALLRERQRELRLADDLISLGVW